MTSKTRAPKSEEENQGTAGLDLRTTEPAPLEAAEDSLPLENPELARRTGQHVTPGRRLNQVMGRNNTIRV